MATPVKHPPPLPYEADPQTIGEAVRAAIARRDLTALEHCAYVLKRQRQVTSANDLADIRKQLNAGVDPALLVALWDSAHTPQLPLPIELAERRSR